MCSTVSALSWLCWNSFPKAEPVGAFCCLQRSWDSLWCTPRRTPNPSAYSIAASMLSQKRLADFRRCLMKAEHFSANICLSSPQAEAGRLAWHSVCSMWPLNEGGLWAAALMHGVTKAAAHCDLLHYSGRIFFVLLRPRWGNKPILGSFTALVGDCGQIL